MIKQRMVAAAAVAALGLGAGSAWAQGAAPAKADKPAAAAPAAEKPKVLDEKTIKAAKAAVDKGLAFLKTQQAEDGSYGHHVGLTAMTLLAASSSYHKYTLSDGPWISLAADWLVKQQRADGAISGDATPIYNTSIAIMALHAVTPVGYKKVVAAGQKYLANDIVDEGENYKPSDKYYGGMGYGGRERPDLSNIQYGIEALAKTDYDPNSDVWKKAQIFVTRCQNRSESNDQEWAGNDGGFVYAPDKSAAGEMRSYGAMSFAGLKSLIFTQARKDDPRVLAVWQWIQKNYDWTQNPGLGAQTLFYYYQTAASALEAYGEPFVPDEKGRPRNWAADMITKLASMQKPDGSWINEANPKYWEDNKILVTARAIVSLNHALKAAGANTVK